MKITILMPVFNTAAYLPDCLDSILAQTETDWELVAIDDFSTDASFGVLSDYAARDSRITALQNDRKGIAPALKKAFRLSRGMLVTRMDSDDIMLPGKLAHLKEQLMYKGPGHLATGLVEYFSADGVGEGYRRYAAWLNALTREGRNYEEIYKECIIPSPAWMAWREDLRRCRAFEEEVYPEDYDLCFLWRQAGLKVIPSDKVIHRWRDRPDRASRTDEHYLDHSFIRLKVRWFLATDHVTARPLVLWGAGKKGKRLAKLLKANGVDFRWVSNNPEKTGKEISCVGLENFNIITALENPQIIIAVAVPDGQKEILAFLEANGLVRGEGYYFFC